ncbi:MAG: amidohydrolase [Planctomycetaceae bacterium]|nr:amidohydrolase [Planctomycetaceae bacterium]
MTLDMNRRDFMKTASAATAAGLLAVNSVEAADKLVPIVDPHQHLWDLKLLKLPWLSGDNVQSINRDFLMKDYLEATKNVNVVKTVFMEVNVEESYQEKEADWVIEMCKADDNPMAGAVIGGYPHSDKFPDYVKKYAKNDYIKGIRTVLHDPDRKKGLCLEPKFVENIQLLGELGLSFDLCMRPDELLDGVKLAEKCPKTRFVVDHCGNMSVTSKDKKLRKKWRQGIKAAAGMENMVCKISGIIVTADKDWKASDLATNMSFCMDKFGEDRAYFAGDWPVCRLKATFEQWVNALKEITKDKSPGFRRKLFHDNAVKFYGLS